MNSHRLFTCFATLLFVGSLSTFTEKPGHNLLRLSLTNLAQASAIQPYPAVQPAQINDLQALAEYQTASLPLYSETNTVAGPTSNVAFEQINSRQTLAQYQATLTIGDSTLSN